MLFFAIDISFCFEIDNISSIFVAPVFFTTSKALSDFKKFLLLFNTFLLLSFKLEITAFNSFISVNFLPISIILRSFIATVYISLPICITPIAFAVPLNTLYALSPKKFFKNVSQFPYIVPQFIYLLNSSNPSIPDIVNTIACPAVRFAPFTAYFTKVFVLI